MNYFTYENIFLEIGFIWFWDVVALHCIHSASVSNLNKRNHVTEK